tara:strand:+ start:212 stop:703 length:492 start_codon:yes stop_codon:yes gene_type:complete
MKNFSKVMLSIIFLALIVGSTQPVFADHITDIFKPVPIKNSEYQFHLQVILRDADDRLISITEATNGYYIPHNVTDEVFDHNFGKKEIVIVDNIKYEKVQYTEKYSLDLPLKLMFFIPAIIEVSHGSEILIVDAYIFQALVPLVYLEEDDVINTQWTIFRKLN